MQTEAEVRKNRRRAEQIEPQVDYNLVKQKLDSVCDTRSAKEQIIANLNLPPEVAESIENIIKLIQRDFVFSWYPELIGEDNAFPLAVRQVLSLALGLIVQKIMSTNLFLFFFRDSTELLLNELELYSNMRIEAMEKHPELFKDINKSDPDTNYKYLNDIEAEFPKEILENRVKVILEEYKYRNQLHPGVQDPETQSGYFHKVGDELLKKLVNENDLKCLGFRMMVREILSNTVLKKSIISCDSNLFNEILFDFLREKSKSEEALENNDEFDEDDDSLPLMSDIPLSDIAYQYVINTDRENAESILNNEKDESFLLRHTVADSKLLILSYKYEGVIYHVSIYKNEDDLFCTDTKGPCNTLTQLVQQYSHVLKYGITQRRSNMLYAEKMPWALSNRKNSSTVSTNDPLLNVISPQTPTQAQEQTQITPPNVKVIDTTTELNNSEISNDNNNGDPLTPIENRTNLKLDQTDDMNQNNVNARRGSSTLTATTGTTSVTSDGESSTDSDSEDELTEELYSKEQLYNTMTGYIETITSKFMANPEIKYSENDEIMNKLITIIELILDHHIRSQYKTYWNFVSNKIQDLKSYDGINKYFKAKAWLYNSINTKTFTTRLEELCNDNILVSKYYHFNSFLRDKTMCSKFISLSAGLIPLNIHLTIEPQAFTREGTPNDIPQLFAGLTTPKSKKSSSSISKFFSKNKELKSSAMIQQTMTKSINPGVLSDLFGKTSDAVPSPILHREIDEINNLPNLEISMRKFQTAVENKKTFIEYEILVKTDDREYSILRRYNRFYQLHKRLVELRLLDGKNIKLPPKNIGLFTFNKIDQELINDRKKGLERYLKEIIVIPGVRNCKLFQSFLESDQPSEMNKSQSQSHLKANKSSDGSRKLSTMNDPNNLNQENENEKNEDRMLSSVLQIDPHELEITEDIIYNLILESCDCRRQNFMKRQVVKGFKRFIKLSLRGSIYKVARDLTMKLTSPSTVVEYISWLQEKLWVKGKGKFLPEKPPKTLEEKEETRKNLWIAFHKCLPGFVEIVLGSNTKSGTMKIFEYMQSDILLRHVLLKFIDLCLLKLYDIKPGYE